MKKLSYLIVLVLILGLVLTGCLLSNVGQVPTNEQSGIAYLTKTLPLTGLVGLWHFDEGAGTAASDSSGYGNHGTLIDGPLWVTAGKFGDALSFDGTDDYVQIANESNFDFERDDPFTLEAWVKTSSNATLRIITKMQNVLPKTGWSFFTYDDSSGPLLYFVLRNNKTDKIRVHGSTDITDGLWHYVAVTYDGSSTASGMQIYVDGVGETMQTTDDNLTASTLNDVKLQISGREGSIHVFNGEIDEVRIWDRALLPEDILNPAISVEKKADTEFAYPDDTVTYEYIVTNTGYVPLSNVDVIDSLGITGNYDSGDTNGNDLLDLEEDWMFTAGYFIPGDAPERLCNTATAEGLYEGDPVVSAISNEVCIRTMCARTIGYWKNHLEVWCDLPEDSMFLKEDEGTLLAYFPGNGIEEYGVNPLEMLRVQLLAAQLNYACFNSWFDYSRYDGGAIFGTMREAQAFLQHIYTLCSDPDPDLNAFWALLSNKEKARVRRVAQPLKDVLEAFNDMGDGCFPIEEEPE